MRAYVPLHLAVNYILFAFTAALGVLQAVAATSQDWQQACVALPTRPRAGMAVGLVLVAIAYAAFWFFAPDLLTPGPAGAELTALFGLSALLALGVARLLARWRQPILTAAPWLTESTKKTGAFSTFFAAQATPFNLAILSFCLLLSSLIGLYDMQLFRLLNGTAGRHGILDSAIQFFMNDYVIPTALVLALLGLWFSGQTTQDRTGNQTTALRALLAMLLASAIVSLINVIYFRPRPFTNHEVTLLFYHPSDSSLPSNAATVGFSLASAVWLRKKEWGRWMLGLAGAIALARVWGGAHYPLDIVAGAWLGGLGAWAINRAVWLDRPIGWVIRLTQRLTLA